MTEVYGGSYRISPLQGQENYIIWRIQMTDILTDMGLWDYVAGEIKQSAKAAANASWLQKDRRALTHIRLRVSNNMMTYIISATTSKEAWDALASVFNTQGTVARITTRRRLFRYAIEDGADVGEHIRIIKQLAEELLISGATIPDNDLAMIILTALPSTWDSFISSISDPDSLTSANLIGRILQEHGRREDRVTFDTTLVTVH